MFFRNAFHALPVYYIRVVLIPFFVCQKISEGTAEAFQSILLESEYPLLKTLTGRPIESYMKIDQLGEVRK